MIYTITEYGGFTRGAALSGYQGLPEKTFNALETFILANSTESETEAVELLSLSARRGVGKIITARNYVGLITMADGTVIEILPKIAGGGTSVSDTKRIFLEMLKTLKDAPFKDFNVSHLHTERLSLFEIFIKMFLDEVSILTKQGLKAAYTPVEGNERFYKGKLLASQNIKNNLVNRERFFVRYDEFNHDRPENRLIKSSIGFLMKVAGDDNNRRNAARLLSFFDGVEYSKSVDGDFSKCFVDRSMNHYDKALSWCRVFLRGNSFTAFAGSEVALALLFPMEKVFESFVAAKFRKHRKSDMSLERQKVRFHLFDDKAFALRPDLVLEFDEHTVVLDTKWKLLSNNARNNGISQSDMYQMYAYSKKYNADRVVLLYPHSDALNRTDIDIKYTSNDNVNVDVKFVDLRNADESISKLLSYLRAKVCRCPAANTSSADGGK